jgi:regulatory protein YycI of two-component signal transduction system YycFG
LLLNLFFGYQIYKIGKGTELGDTNQLTSKDSISSLLSRNEITLMQAIPSELPKMSDIVVEYLEKGEKVYPLETPIQANSVIFTMAKIQAALQRQIPEARSYKMDEPLSSDKAYIMNQLYEEYPMYNSKIILRANNGKFETYSKMYAKILPNTDAKDEQVMSAGRSLAFIIENYLEPGTVIRSIELGYRGQSFETKRQLLSPNWRFVLEDGTQYFVSAIHGEVEVVEKGQ